MAVRLLSAVVLAWATVSVAGDSSAPPALRGADSLAAAEPDSTTPTPQNSTDPTAAFDAILQMISREMHSEHWQWLVALVAFCIGAVAVVTPGAAFRNLTVSVIFGVMYTMAMGDLHDRYRNQHFEHAVYINGVMLWQIIVAIELAACASLVAWRGFDGVKQFIAMVIGIWPMKMLQATLNDSGIFGASPWWNIIVVTISAVFGLILMRNQNLESLLGYVFPFIGGKLISCSVGWMLWYLVDFTWSKPWLDFYHSLPFDETRSSIQPAPGIGWSSPQTAGPDWIGWAGGTALWLFIALCSGCYHHHQVKKQKAHKKSHAEAMKQALLAEEQQ